MHKAAQTVAAHPGPGSVLVPQFHAERIPPGDDQTIRSETTVPVAQRSDLLGIDHRRPAAVNNQKIIAAALIFFQDQTLHPFLQQSILPGPFADLHGIGRRPLAQLIAAAP